MIRHALYGAKHHFEIMDKLSGKYNKFIITGQACENTDRLGENIPLIERRLDDVLITYTAGAYITSMSSNYNLLGRPMEILVDGSKVKIIRKPDDLPSILGPFLT
jgi:Diaminopimelate decarboxylase